MCDKQERIAVYAGSFDPITNGHLWMIRQAARIFDTVIVAIGVNPDKRGGLFSDKEREDMLAATVADLPNARVGIFNNQFLVRYATSVGAQFIVRGIRNQADAEAERAMRYMNADFAPEVSTVFLMPPRDLAEISSSFIKGLVGPEGWQDVVRGYVPPLVLDMLEEHHAEMRNERTDAALRD